MIHCYAAHATSSTNRTALRGAGWGLLGSAAYRWTDREWRARDEGGLGWALDNGAWTSYAAGKPFDFDQYKQAVCESGRLDFVVVPDVVEDRDATLRLIDQWLPWVVANANAKRVLVVAQDGMTDSDLSLNEGIGVFVGGSTDFKVSTLGYWARTARSSNAYCHVGRVNSVRRLHQCRIAGVDSIDGSGPSRFKLHLEQLERSLNIPTLWDNAWVPSEETP